MSRSLRVLLAVAAVLLIALVFLFISDGWLRSLIEYQVAARTGRTLNISGDFAVDWSLRPRVHAERVSLDNAAWGSHPKMLEAERIAFTLNLLDALKGDLVLPQVELSRPWVLLEFSADGERNWIPKRKPPVIERLVVDSGTLVYRNPAHAIDLTVAIATDRSVEESRQTRVQARGTFRGLKTSGEGTGGPVLNLRDRSSPYPLDINARIGATAVSARGEVTGLVALSKVNLDLKLQGPGLRELGGIIEIAFPETAKYWVAGNLTREGDTWRFMAFKGALGKSDVAGEFLFDRGRERPFVRADLKSRQLVLDELPFGGGERKPSQWQRLRAFDADVTLAAKAIRREERTFGNLSAQLKLDHGELRLAPLRFEIAEGKVDAGATLDARVEPPQLDAAATVSRLKLEKLFKKASGTAAVNAKVKSSGGSFADMVANSNGDVSFVVAEGELRGLLVSYMGMNAMGLVSALIGDRSTVPVNCVVGDFALKSGVMHTEVLVIDTTKTDIAGTGTINLAKRTWDLTLSPLKEKEGIFSGLFSSGSPVHVGGTFKNPSFSTDASGIAVRGGAALALGVINPLAALIPLLAPGSDKESDCVALVKNVKAGTERASLGRQVP